jgi:hypothetical protein
MTTGFNWQGLGTDGGTTDGGTTDGGTTDGGTTDRDATTTDPNTLDIQALASSFQQGLNVSLLLWSDFNWANLPGRGDERNELNYVLDENGELIIDESRYPIIRVGETVSGALDADADTSDGIPTKYTISLSEDETYIISAYTLESDAKLKLSIFEDDIKIDESISDDSVSIRYTPDESVGIELEISDAILGDDAGLDSFVLEVSSASGTVAVAGTPVQSIVGGTDGNDHLSDSITTSVSSTGVASLATMGFAGDDVLYSSHSLAPILVGGTGDDSYIIENSHTISQSLQSYLFNEPAVLGEIGNINGAPQVGLFSQIIETGGDDDDSIIAYNNQWAWAATINGEHLLMSNETQSDALVIWNFQVEDNKIENFWFDFDQNGLREHYTFDEFISYLTTSEYWLGNLTSQSIGISNTTLNDLHEVISRAVAHSDSIENIRVADTDTALSIARLYQTVFDRTPDGSGLNFWIDQWEDISQNLSLSRIADEFVNSDEFVTTYGSLDDSAFVTALYDNVLGRNPDDNGLDFWTSQLATGSARADIVVGFSESLENKLNTTTSLEGLTETTPGVWDIL